MQAIKTLEQLESAANARQAVVIPALNQKPKAAAFYLSMRGRTILQFLRMGMFLYRKP